MNIFHNPDPGQCMAPPSVHADRREEMDTITDQIIASSQAPDIFTHIDHEPIPSQEQVIEIINRLRNILFPGYFSKRKVVPENMKYYMGQSVSVVYNMLTEQIIHSSRHECSRFSRPCTDCLNRSHDMVMEFLKSVPEMRRILATDVQAAYDGDPAATSHDEIIFSYPGVFAIMVYRVAHKLLELGVPLLPRIMTEYAHCITGIDIHPGAVIGKRFAIDHGTGVVIGETTRIGENVRLYQGVTIGALSLPRDAGAALKGKKRHPTLEDDVIIYSGATILGGQTVIGARSIIGGNVWLTESVPPDTRVFMETPKLVFR